MFIDTALFALINGHLRNKVFDFVLPLFSANWLLWLALIIFLAFYAGFCRKRYGEALWRVAVLSIFLALSAGAADWNCNMLKDAVGRYRPFQSYTGTHYLTSEHEWVVVDQPTFSPDTTGGSFPSAHTATSMAVAVVLSLLFRKANPWIYLLPLMVGWSRIYVGKHYPFDVIGGLLVGLLSVFAVWWLCHLIFSIFSRRRRNSVRKQ